MADEDATMVRIERAARIRAARAYADIPQKAVAECLGVSDITVKRMERGTRDITADDCWKIADLCGVPREFMERGFVSTPEELRAIPAHFDQRFDALEQRLGWTVARAIAGEAVDILRGDDGDDEEPARAAG